MTSYTLSPFLLMRIQTDGADMDFYFLVLLHAAYFCFFFSSCFCLFMRQILAEAEKSRSKRKVDSSQTVHMTLKRFGPVSMFLRFHNTPVPQRLVVE